MRSEPSAEAGTIEFTWRHRGFWHVALWIFLIVDGLALLAGGLVAVLAWYLGASLEPAYEEPVVFLPLPVLTLSFWLLHLLFDDVTTLICRGGYLTLSSRRSGVRHRTRLTQIRTLEVKDNTHTYNQFPLKPNWLRVRAGTGSWEYRIWGDFSWNFTRLQKHVVALKACLRVGP